MELDVYRLKHASVVFENLAVCRTSCKEVWSREDAFSHAVIYPFAMLKSMPFLYDLPVPLFETVDTHQF